MKFRHPLLELIVISLWLPCLWSLAFFMEILFFANRTNLGLVPSVFEKLVIIASFLFYRSRGILAYVDRPVAQIFFSFAAQFFFWWLATLIIILIKQRLTPKGGHHD